MLRVVTIAVLLLTPRFAASQPALEGVYTLRDRAGLTVMSRERWPECGRVASDILDGWRGDLRARYRGKQVMIRDEAWAVRFVDAKMVTAVRPAPKDAAYRLEIVLVPRKSRLASALLLYWGIDKHGKELCVTGFGLVGDYAR